MHLIDETTDLADEIADVATEITAAAADLAIEGAQAALGSRRRLTIPTVALLLVVLAAAVGYRRWRASRDESIRPASDKAPSSGARAVKDAAASS